MAQREDFKSTIKRLQHEGEIDSKDKLLVLRPYVDERGILRVGGRLRNADLPIEHRHPMLLNGRNPLAKLLARHHHEMNLHAGPQTLLYALRQKTWIIDERNLCRKIVHECIQCFRTKPKLIQQLMGETCHLQECNQPDLS